MMSQDLELPVTKVDMWLIARTLLRSGWFWVGVAACAVIISTGELLARHVGIYEETFSTGSYRRGYGTGYHAIHYAAVALGSAGN
jgi:hypothetical protein